VKRLFVGTGFFAGIRGKLFLLSLALLTVAGSIGFLFLRHTLDETLEANVRDELTVRLALVQREVEGQTFAIEPSKEWDDLADDLGARANGRVTIFDSNERILGDSRLTLQEIIEGREDDRPEFRTALSGGTGRSTRYSAVLKERVTYAAAPVMRNGEAAFVVRVAIPSSQMAATVTSLERELLILCIAGVLIAVAVSSIAGHLALRGVRDLTLTARRMASGDLTMHLRSDGHDEVADLGRSREQLADGLRSSMKELVGERDLLSGVLSTMREGVLILDRDGLVALINPALREMLFLGDDDVGGAGLEFDQLVEHGIAGLGRVGRRIYGSRAQWPSGQRLRRERGHHRATEALVQA